MGVEYLAFSVPEDIHARIDVAELPSEAAERLVEHYYSTVGESDGLESIELGKSFRYLYYLMGGENITFGLPDPAGRPLAHAFFGQHPIGDESSYLTPSEVKAASKALRENLGESDKIAERYEKHAKESEQRGFPMREEHKEAIIELLKKLHTFFEHASRQGRAVVIEIS